LEFIPSHQVIPSRVVRQHCPAPFGLNETKLITISKYIVQSFFKALTVKNLLQHHKNKILGGLLSKEYKRLFNKLKETLQRVAF
jgi:hypothetical protein